MDTKNLATVSVQDAGARGASSPPTSDRELTKSTRHDTHDMARMGHKQQLIRHYTLWKTMAFTCVAMVSWELVVFTLNQGLIGGGRAGLVWSFIWNFVGFMPLFVSMAELASMAPICGSQYHWVSEFGPEKWQRGMSYFTGWMSVLAWQAGNAQGFLLTGQLIQVLASIAYPDFVPQPYQTSLITIAVALLTFFVNVYLHHYLPKVQSLMFVGHFGLFVVLIVSIWVSAPKATTSQVWMDFEGTGGWQPMVLGVLAGQLSGFSAMTGVDTVSHISEEVEDASYTVPRVMLASYGANAVFSILSVVTICYAIPDLAAALGDPSTYPAVYVLRQTMSENCTIAFISLTTVVLFAGNVNYMVAVSRDLWAFARDNGTPFPRFLSHVSSTRHIPTAAIGASCVLGGALSLLYIGSPTAYYAIVSLFLVAIIQCYLFTIGCVLWRRVFHPGTLPAAGSRFSLGRWGVPVNIAALLWAVWAFFWSFWPQGPVTDPATMNWAAVLFFGVLVGAAILYVFRARFVFEGPVALVAGRKGNAELAYSLSSGGAEDDEEREIREVVAVSEKGQ